VLKGETELSHLTIVPVCTLNNNTALVEPEQIVDPPPTEPASVVGLTVTDTSAVVAAAHGLFCTTTRYLVVSLGVPGLKLVVVLLIDDQVVNGDIELSHLTTDPVFPLNVNEPAVEPWQILDAPLMVPATEGEFTVTVAVSEIAAVHDPL
jgi:hypothetical protein